MSDPTFQHLLSNKQLKRSNRAANLARNICLILAVTTVIFCLLFQASLDRVLNEVSRYISVSQTCVGGDPVSGQSHPVPSFKDLKPIGKDPIFDLLSYFSVFIFFHFRNCLLQFFSSSKCQHKAMMTSKWNILGRHTIPRFPVRLGEETVAPCRNTVL